MSWIDNIIAEISPRFAFKRMAWKKGFEELSRNYDAGERGRLNRNWNPQNYSAQITDTYSRDNVRARARDLERNSDMMNSVISAFSRNIIGEGFTLQARTENEKLNEEIEWLWKLWTKRANCDITKTQNIIQILRMVERRKKIDGGILIYKCHTDDGILPFKLQCLEVDEIERDRISPFFSSNKVIDGIEVNGHGVAKGYWIKQYSLDGITETQSKFVPAEDIIYVFTKTRPSQVREMSDMNPTITRIRDTQEFMTAVSVKQRIEACLSVFIKKQTPADTLGRAINGSNKKIGYDGKMLSPGMIKELNPGDDVIVVNPTGQAEDATQFVKLQGQLMAAGQGLSYEAITRDMSQSNYSSARQGLIEDNLTYVEDREILNDVVDEIYEEFIKSAVLSGKLVIKDFWQNKESYFRHDWIHAPKRWIDPLKESNATKVGLQTGQKTFQQIAAENGKDWREQIDDIVEVLEYGASKNINLEEILYGKKSSN